MEQGVNPLAVSSFVGHKDVQTTVGIYWEAMQSFQKQQLRMEDIKTEKNIYFTALQKTGQQLDNSKFLDAYLPEKAKAAKIARLIFE